MKTSSRHTHLRWITAGNCALIVCALLLSGCEPQLKRRDLKTWESAASEPNGYLGLPLESGQILVTNSDSALDVFIGLFPTHYNPYVHSAILVFEDGKPFVYEALGRQSLNLRGGPPTDAISGTIRRVPFRRFVDRYYHVEIWNPVDLDKARVAEFARYHYTNRTPFDPYFRYDEHDSMYCTEFVALALESAGADPFELTPNRNNDSVRVILDWLKLPDEFIQTDQLLNSSRWLATISTEHTLTEIRVLNGVRRELHRRFTCDQRVGHVFHIVGLSPQLREPITRFLRASMRLYDTEAPPPDAETVDRDVRQLATEMFGELPAPTDCG